jgi:anti-sigma-K factor RskA
MSETEASGHDARREDLAAYALGALPAGEAAELELHLRDCEPCRSQLRWLQPAVDLLPRSVEQLSPPRRLRAELVATVRGEARRAAADRGLETSRWRSWRGLAWRPATALAGMAMLAAGVGVGYALERGGAHHTAIAAHLTPAAPRGVAAELDVEGDAGVLSVQDMPPLHGGDVYEVWVERNGMPEPSSLFAVRSDRSGAAAVPGPLVDGDSILVTREPPGGSGHPTSPPLLRAELD